MIYFPEWQYILSKGLVDGFDCDNFFCGCLTKQLIDTNYLLDYNHYSRNNNIDARASIALFKAWKRSFFVKGEFVFSFHRLRYLRHSFLNIIMFVPMGYFLPIVTKRARNWWNVILFGVGISFGIELLQYVTLLGMFDVDDLFNNTIGVVIGWIIWKIFLEKKLRNESDRAVTDCDKMSEDKK